MVGERKRKKERKKERERGRERERKRKRTPKLTLGCDAEKLMKRFINGLVTLEVIRYVEREAW